MAGATGLDYAGVLAYLRQACPKRRRRAEVFEALRAAERAVLAVWAERRADEDHQRMVAQQRPPQPGG